MSTAAQRPAAPPPAPSPARGVTSSPGLVLAIIATVQLMIVLDGTVVNVALPDIQRDLGFSAASLSWVINAYALAFGGLLLLGGRMGDILGRRRTFIAGVSLFTFASLLGGLASSSGLLLAARALQGVGAAIAAPSTLALLATNFEEGAARNRALGVFTVVSAAGGSVGLVLGGALTDLASWRWVLAINVPIGLAVVLLTPRIIAETERHEATFDLSGAILSTAGVGALVYGFIRASQEGWGDAGTVGAFAGAVALLVAFFLVERTAGQPIVPLRLLANGRRAVGYAGMLLVPAAMFGHFYLVAQYLQNVLGYSPLETGLAFMPLTVAIFAVGQALPRFIPRFGFRPFLVSGTALTAVGLALLSRLDQTTAYFPGIAIPVLIVGFGAALAFLPLSIVILEGVREEDSGAASGIMQAAQQVGSALGIAILVSIFVSASGGLQGGEAAAAAGSADVAATVDGIQSALQGATAFALLAFLLVLAGLRGGGAPAQATAAASEDDLALEPADAGLGLEIAAGREQG